MTKTGLLLVTGFLGAGKTTFLTGYLRRFADKRLYVIVNEFGNTGVDGLLLSGQGASIREISGGSVFCSCRMDQFEQALADALAYEPEQILVEASGLSDPSPIRRITDRYAQIEYIGCVALADALNFGKVLATSRTTAKQLAVADVILLNKTDLAEPEQTAQTLRMLAERFPAAAVHATRQGAFSDEWLEGLKSSREDGGQAGGHAKDIALQSAAIAVRPEMTSTQLTQFLALFAEDSYRIKGIIRLADGVFQVNGVGGAVEIRPYSGPLPEHPNQLTALSGGGTALLKSIRKAREWYPDFIGNVE